MTPGQCDITSRLSDTQSNIRPRNGGDSTKQSLVERAEGCRVCPSPSGRGVREKLAIPTPRQLFQYEGVGLALLADAGLLHVAWQHDSIVGQRH